jgi:hypothetical protein
MPLDENKSIFDKWGRSWNWIDSVVYIKILSTFELWLELSTRCKDKTLLGLVNKLFDFSSM